MKHHALQARLGQDADHETFCGWRDLAFLPKPSSRVEGKHRRRFGDVDDLVRVRYREKNPPAHLRIPPSTVRIGEALDLVTVFNHLRTTWDFEIRDWHMLTDPDAMDQPAGRAGLYLVRGKLEKNDDEPDDAGAETYARWHKRDFVHLRELDTPELLGVYVGHAEVIGYRSDKWGKRGKTHDYSHDFQERGHVAPEVWADREDLSRARALVIVGGTMRITEKGID